MTEINTQKLSFFHPISLLATWFGAGKIPFAPGTMGTLAALPFAYLIHVYGGEQMLLVASLMLFLLGVWVSERYMKANNTEDDPGEIVIDEVAAVWLLLVALPVTLNGYIFGFLLFRVFDIWKPWPVSVCDRGGLGGFGVMIDDLAAAIYPVVLIGIIAMISGAFGFTFLSDFYSFLGKNGF